jgi:enamine deaminase RidA (YjgF/YER057c/UK114 family)
MDRDRVTTGTEWEPRVGYARAVRVGDRILVSGTTANDDEGDPVAPGDPAGQTRRALETVVAAIADAGGSREHVVRTRMYVTDADDWETIGAVHGEFFGDVRPAATMVEVSALVDPAYLVEIEAEAVVPDGEEA